MPAYVLTCDQEWVGTTCPGTLASVDIEPVSNFASPFDWTLLDPAELSALFAGGFGIVLSIQVMAFGAAVVLDVLRKS